MIRQRRVAVAVGLGRVVVGVRPHGFARYLVGNGEVHLLCAAQQSCVDGGNTVDCAQLLADSDVLLACRNLVVLARVYIVEIGAERYKIVIHIGAVRRGRVVIGFELVLLVDCRVVSLAFHFVVGLVEHGGLCPVAVEREVRDVKVDFLLLTRLYVHVFELDKALDVHAVLEVRVDVLLVGVGERENERKLYGAVRLYRNLIAIYRAVRAGLGCKHEVRAVEHRRGFGDVALVGRGNAFGHGVERKIVLKLFVRQVDEVEFHFINAAARLVVAELELGAVAAVDGYVRFGVYGVIEVGKACALLSRGVRIVLLVLDNLSRRHHELVSHVHHFLRRELGIGVLEVLTDKHDYTAEVRRCHRRAGQLVIAVNGVAVLVGIATRDSGLDVAAVSGDFGLELERGRRTPAGEVGHERACGVTGADGYRASRLLRQLFAVVFRDGNGRNVVGLAHRHENVAVYIIIDNAGCRAVIPCERRFFLERVGAEADKRYLALQRLALFRAELSEAYSETYARDGDVLERLGLFCAHFSAVDKFLNEVVFLGGYGVGFLIEENLSVVAVVADIAHEVMALRARNGGDGKRGLVGGRRADGARVGVGHEVGVALRAAEA